MSGRPAAASQPDGPLAVIAAFDDWADLEAALAAMSADSPACYCAVLHARADARPDICRGASELAAVEFTRTRTCFTRGEGALARALGHALGHGTHSLTHALQRWVSHAQAEQLEDHVARGRLLLWVQPITSDQFQGVCGHLTRASPHVVELCKADSLSRKTSRQ